MITSVSESPKSSWWTQQATKVLTRFSHYVDLPFGGDSATEPLKVLQREYPDLEEIVRGKRVLDFGCGHGDQAAALAERYGCEVTGLEIVPSTLQTAREKHPHIRFIDKLDSARYDVIISLNAMEHFTDPMEVLRSMRQAVTRDGLILVTFGPPWYAPYGSHMHFFCKIPWLQLWFPEEAVMSVRANWKHDGAKRYEDVEGGLGKMSLRKFERVTRESGLKIWRRRYTGVKKLNFLTWIPVIRELTTVHATVLMTRKYGFGGGAAIVEGPDTGL